MFGSLLEDFVWLAVSPRYAPLVSSDLERTVTSGGAAPVEERDRVGRFELIEVLGSGGMGRVYLARDVRLSRDVALKLVRDNRDDTARARFEREATAMAQLSHPNLVTVYDVGSADGELFIAMEYIPGGNLAKWLRSSAREWRDIVDMFVAAGRGLAAAHDAGIVHRDFKPSNVLVSDRGGVYVTDFGIALSAGLDDAPANGGAPSDVRLTAAGASVGTPRYMSPEQHDGGLVDARSDQWSFGVALIEALTGSPPFPGSSYEDIVRRVRAGEPVIDERALPRGTERVLRRAIARKPTERYPTLAAMLDELERAVRPRRSRWPLLAAIGLIGVAGATALAFAAARAGGARAVADAGVASIGDVSASGAAASSDAAVRFAAGTVADAGSAPAPVDAAGRKANETTSKPRNEKTAKKTDWRPRSEVCAANHEKKYCINCCQKGDKLMPYPDCGCYFDGDAWDREHGKKGVAKPLDPRIDWRPLGQKCFKNDELQSCSACCREGVLKPYPDCGCYFDGTEWDRTHGKQGVAKPLDPKIDWRPTGETCFKSDENKRCSACCREGVLAPYPDCKCYYDGDAWDREHGRAP